MTTIFIISFFLFMATSPETSIDISSEANVETNVEASTSPIFELFRQFIGKSMAENSASSFGRWLNGTLRAVETDGSMTMEYTVRPEMLNPAQTLHGGVAAAMMDDVIGAAIFSLGKKNLFTTVNLVVDYFAAAKVGDTLLAKVSLVKHGSTILHIQCELWSMQKNRMIARCISNMMKTDVQSPF
jgi:acyl-coenzyme A thioesterase 13